MPLNELIAKISIERLSKNDTSLYDAIVEMDRVSVCTLINKRYASYIKATGYVKEPVDIHKIAYLLELGLNTKKINLKMCC